VVEVLIKILQLQRQIPDHCHNLEHEDMGMMAAFETT
jgi:hypothetical protein